MRQGPSRAMGQVSRQFTVSDQTFDPPNCCPLIYSILQSGRCRPYRNAPERGLNDSRLSDWFRFCKLVSQFRAAASQGSNNRLLVGISPNDSAGWRIPARGLDDHAIAELTPMILRLQNGFDVALEIVWIEIAVEKREERPLSPEILAAGRAIIEACEFDRRLRSDTHPFGEVIEACLAAQRAFPMLNG